MANIIDTAVLATIVGLFVDNKGLRNVTTRNERITAEGDGYVSEISRLVVTGENTLSKKQIYDTVVKAPLPTLEARQHVPITMMFNRELFFYNEIVPKYEKFQENLTKPQRLYLPKTYFSSDEYLKEFLVMENLKTAGYGLADSKNGLDLAHGTLAVRSLAKLHALSLIYKEKEPNSFLEISKELNDNFMVDGTDFNSVGIHKYAMHVFNKFVGCIRNVEHKNRLLNAAGSNFSTALQEFWGNGTIKVISHADYWINNIMFKYKDEKPTEAVIIDYQMVRYSSLVNDLLSFLGTCFELDLRRNHYQELIDAYYNSLGEFLSAAGYDIENICTRDVFNKELKHQSFFGVAIAIFMIPFYDTEVPDIRVLFSGDLPESFDIVSPKFEKLANDLIEDYVTWGFL